MVIPNGMFKTISKISIFEDPILKFFINEIEAPNGEIFTRRIIEYHNAAAVVAVNEENELLLVKHYRHPIKQTIWEIPGGMLNVGEDPHTCALRELQEETGYQSNEIEHLISFHPEPAFTTQIIHLFKARQLQRTSSMKSESEINDLKFFNTNQVKNMIANGDIISSWSVIGALLLLYSPSERFT